MTVLFLILGAIVELINSYLHWWQTSNEDIAAIVLLVGALVLIEQRK